MKSSIKMFGIALGSIAIVGGGVSTAAYFLIDQQEPTDNAYKFEGQYFKTEKQVRDYIIKNSEATKVPTFNDQAYWDEVEGEFTLKGAWDAAFDGFQVIQDGYESESMPQITNDSDFFEITDNSKLLSNSQEINFKTAYIVSTMGNELGTPAYGKHMHGMPFYIYPTKEQARDAWMKINSIKTIGRDADGNLNPANNVYTTISDFELAFNNRTLNSSLFLDQSIGEVEVPSSFYGVKADKPVFEFSSTWNQYFPNIVGTYPNGSSIETAVVGGNLQPIGMDHPSRMIDVVDKNGVHSKFMPSWTYTDVMRDYLIENTFNEEFATHKKYTKIFFIADARGNIIDGTKATTWGNLPLARQDGFEISNPTFYHFNEQTNSPEGILSTFEDLVQMKAVKESGFDLIQKDQTVIHYDDVNGLIKDLITNGKIEII